MMKCAEPSLDIVLKTYAGSGPTEISPSLIEACVAVRDQLVDAALRGKLSERQGDLLDAMTRLIRSAPTIESLVEIAMAIAYDVGRAQGQSGIVADLAKARGVSRQHADRQIKRGRVLLAFHKSGKSLGSPTGRKIEMLAELPEEHWIPGWEFVVSKAEKKGKVSDKDAETFMEVYKYPLVEAASADYLVRTRLNVRDSDGTLIVTSTSSLSRGSPPRRDLQDCHRN